MGEAMADQDILHTAEIVKAAIPFVDSRTKGMADVFVKVFELMGTIKYISNPGNMTACGLEADKLDMEGLLNGIRPVCNHREREVIDRILNFFNIKRMFEMYNNVMETMKNMQGFGDFAADGFDAETVMSNFSGMNFESIFNSFRKTPETETGAGDTDGSDYTAGFYAEKNLAEDEEEAEWLRKLDSILENKQEDKKEGTQEDKLVTDSEHRPEDDPEDGPARHQEKEQYDKQNNMQGEEESRKRDEEISRQAGNEKGADNTAASALGNNSGSGFRNNDMMLEIIKSMVPQDKVSTFENLSMLLNSVSYDNNSKSDQKENKDG